MDLVHYVKITRPNLPSPSKRILSLRAKRYRSEHEELECVKFDQKFFEAEREYEETRSAFDPPSNTIGVEGKIPSWYRFFVSDLVVVGGAASAARWMLFCVPRPPKWKAALKAVDFRVNWQRLTLAYSFGGGLQKVIIFDPAFLLGVAKWRTSAFFKKVKF